MAAFFNPSTGTDPSPPQQPTMASSSQPTKNSKTFTVSSLLSPPEMRRLDSFGSPNASSMTETPQSSFASDNAFSGVKHEALSVPKGEGEAYASPPISPYFHPSNKENVDCSPVASLVRDPQLFPPGDTATALSPDMPLFSTDTVSPEAEALVAQHMAKNDARFRNPAMKPAAADYLLAISVVSNVYRNYNRNPVAWLKQERAFNAGYGPPTRVEKKRRPLKKLAPAPYFGAKVATAKAPARVAPRVPRVPRPAKRTPQSRIYDSFEPFQTPSPKAPRAPTNRDDVDYHLLPDFSPPLSTLPKGNSKVLKADWKGQMLDLSADPDRHLLHEAEVNLAATLRLSCATYLCSKRRIFQARIEALRIGKEFRKTDAQQACKIDVNKASKLHTAFEKVGWFDRKYFEQYL